MSRLTFADVVLATHDPSDGTIHVDVGRCKGCKHWAHETPSGPQPCNRILFLSCRHDGEAPLASLCAEDENAAGLQTMPEFGCLLFEGKI